MILLHGRPLVIYVLIMIVSPDHTVGGSLEGKIAKYIAQGRNFTEAELRHILKHVVTYPFCRRASFHVLLHFFFILFEYL
jgi:hypothetical protein